MDPMQLAQLKRQAEWYAEQVRHSERDFQTAELALENAKKKVDETKKKLAENKQKKRREKKETARKKTKAQCLPRGRSPRGSGSAKKDSRRPPLAFCALHV